MITPQKKPIPRAWGCTYPPSRVDELTESLIEWVEDHILDDKEFLFGDWAFRNKVNPKHLSYIATKSDRFKEVYLLARAFQEHILCKGSLTRKLDGGFAKFMLAVHHGYTVDPEKEREDELKNDFTMFLTHIRSLKQDKDDGTKGIIPETAPGA